MKRLTSFYTTLIFITCLFSCKKDKESSHDEVYIKATINGVAWETDSLIIFGTSNQTFQGVIGKLGNTAITLSIPDTVATGFNFRVNGTDAVTLKTFDVSFEESDCMVTWTTFQDDDLKWFVVEMALADVDPYTFYPIDTISAAGAGNGFFRILWGMDGTYNRRYNFRLKLIDKNDLATYSSVRTVYNASCVYYTAPGKEARRGFNGTLTVTGKEGDYITGTFSGKVKLWPQGEVVHIENGRFRSRYK